MGYAETYNGLFYEAVELLGDGGASGEQIESILRSLSELFQTDAAFIYSCEPPAALKLTARCVSNIAPELPQTSQTAWFLSPREHFAFDTIITVPFHNEKHEVIGVVGAARITNEAFTPEQHRDLVSLLMVIGSRIKMQMLQRRIERMAFYDPLTGVFNRRKFENDFPEAVARGIAGGKEGYILFFDLDRFKMINDVFGHEAGDRLLINFSQYVHSHPDFGGHMYRFGGDEFIMFLEDCSEDRLLACTETMMRRFAEPWDLGGNEAYCTASVGIACFPRDGGSYSELVRSADTAMYAAKRRGKNRLEFFDPKDDKAMPEIAKEVALRLAIADDCREFVLLLLPIIDAKTNRWVGAESLVRWNSPKYGMLRPNEFLPICRQLGLISQLEEWIIKTAVGLARTYFTGTKLYLSINTSDQQIQDDSFADNIAAVAKESGCAPELILVELSEPSECGGLEHVKKAVNGLRAAGIRVAADGLGVAHRSLSILSSVKFDMVKVDCSLGMRCLESEFDRELARALVRLSNTVNTRVCAEGVFNKDVKDFLVKSGYDYLQGSYFSEPLPVDKFMEALKTQSSRGIV